MHYTHFEIYQALVGIEINYITKEACIGYSWYSISHMTQPVTIVKPIKKSIIVRNY